MQKCFVAMLRKVELFVFLLLLSVSVAANNLSLGSTVKIVEVDATAVTFELTVRWENSWRDSYNNDAAWVFFKYRTAGSDWTHLFFEDSVRIDRNYTVLPGKSNGENIGFFVYRDAVSSGTSETKCQVTWKYPSWIKEGMFTANQVFVMAQGIEMVYIPFGGYTLGDGSSDNGFAGEDGTTPYNINSLDDLDFRTQNGEVISLSDFYPNGYNGYYLMKYELSQEQYVSFLNALTRDQQIQLLGERLSGLKKGDYLFGVIGVPSCRNGIIVSQAASSTKGAVFDNNLDKDDNYGGEADGQTLASNYMSIKDLLAYAAWAGLRPMTELEYEKACRRLLPQGATEGEYAWGNVSLTAMSGLTAETEGRQEESPASGNVNANGAFGFAPGEGPVRCGAFASIASSRETAGAGFSGIMEMSGNLGELCVNTLPGIVNRFDGSLHGSGLFTTDLWGGRLSASFFGLRGGGFSSVPDRLRVSDREEITNRFTSSDYRDSTVGFRALRMLNRDELAIDPGEITVGVSSVVCSGAPFIINSRKEAGIPGLSSVIMSYEWYRDGVLIPDARGKSLNYPTGIYNPKTADAVYHFTRKAICAIGEMETEALTVTVPGKLDVKLPSGVSEAVLLCGEGTTLTASRLRVGKFIWKNAVSGITDRITSSVASDNYKPAHQAFGYMAGLRKIRCISEMDGCRDSMDMALRVEASCYATLSAEAINLKSSTDAGSITATLCGEGTIAWFYKDAGGVETALGDVVRGNSAVYTPEYADFANTLGAKTVICRTTTGEENGCKDEKEFLVHVSAELSAGTIGGPAITCGGTTVSVKNVTLPGVVGMDGLRFTYQWFKDGSITPVEGETGADLLNYPISANSTANTVRHSFTRKAFCTSPALQSPLTAAVNVDVPGVLALSTVTLNLASGTSSGTSTSSRSLSGTFNWYYKDGSGETLISGPVTGTSSVYIPTHGHFANTVGEKKVVCRSIVAATSGNCVDSRELTVNVSASLTPGTLTAPAVACGSATISGTAAASGVPGISPTYEWSVAVNGAASTVIAGQTGQNLSYSLPANATTANISYAFTRKAIFASGIGNSNTVAVQVPGKLSLSAASVNLSNGSAATVTASRSMGTFSWLSGATVVGSASTYIPKHSDFGNALGNGKTIVCRSNVTVGNGGGSCQQDVNLTVNVSATINAGAITAPATACSGATITLGNQTNGVVNGVGVAPVYEWYMGDTQIGTGAAMNYKVPVNNTTNAVNYTFTRKSSYVGATTTSVSKTVAVQGNVSISTSTLSLNGTGASGSSTATLAGGTFVWKYGNSVTAGATYTPTYKSIDYTTNIPQVKVVCTGTVNGCSSTSTLTVNQGIVSCGDGAVAVGNLCWMSSNLNTACGTVNVDYWENAPYGKWYTWEKAKTCCPSGWRLPSVADWNIWEATYGPQVGYKMKTATGWTGYSGTSGNGDNSVGFNGMPGGAFSNKVKGEWGCWWSLAGTDSRDLQHSETNLNGSYGLDDRMSVRCVQNR